MSKFPDPKNAKRSWPITVTCLVAGLLLLIVAFAPSVFSDRSGLSHMSVLLEFAAAAILVLVFVNTWRSLWKYLLLLGSSVVGLFVFILLHNLFYALAELTSDIIILHYLFEALHVISFLVAVFLCPGTLFVGAAGSAVMFFRIGLASKEMIRKIVWIAIAICFLFVLMMFLVFIVSQLFGGRLTAG